MICAYVSFLKAQTGRFECFHISFLRPPYNLKAEIQALINHNYKWKDMCVSSPKVIKSVAWSTYLFRVWNAVEQKVVLKDSKWNEIQSEDPRSQKVTAGEKGVKKNKEGCRNWD